MYRSLAADDTEIVSIHVMETKSALVNTARMAAAMAPGRVHVVDSGTTTLGLGLLTLTAARMARDGATAADIVARLERLVTQVHTFAAIPQMTQLRRSGRVSLGQALMAGLLAIKPILYIGQSVVEVTEKVRSWPRALECMVELAKARVGDARVSLAVVHTNAETEARQLLEQVRGRFNCDEAMVAEAGTTLAAHAGAGALGIVALQVDA